jgi:phosphatidate cytidylyltransferase
LAMVAVLALAPGLPHPWEWWRGTLLVGTMVLALWFLLGRKSFDSFVDWVLTIAIVVYTGGLLGSLISLRGLHSGAKLVLLTLVLTWAYDTGAYFAGRTWGSRPFMQWISPSKTWEGVVGGVILSIVVALIAAVPLSVSLLTGLALGVAVPVAAQAGDLVESMMKRYSGVKDSGKIIPGHGGVLDRIDSLLFSGTAAFYVCLISGYH